MERKKRLRKIISAIVIMVLSFSIMTGSTFAILTGRDEVNVAVKSGKIDVTATLDKTTLKVFSKDVEQTATDSDGKLLFENGGTASFTDEGDLVLDRVTPGDKATFEIKVVNASNIAIKYRVIWSIEGELANALVAKVGEEAVVNGESEWADWDLANGNEYAIQMSVELPYETDVNFQDKTATISYVVEAVQGNTNFVDTWDGTADTSWFTENPNATEYSLKTAEEFAGLLELLDDSANYTSTVDNDQEEIRSLFYKKTIKLEQDFDLYLEKENDEGELEPVCFDPIGSYRNDMAFDGTLDGQGHTIKNLNQNTWALDNGYYYNDLGLGLFGLVNNATIKNLVIDNANISGESAICGVVAATAYGDCTFENITVKNTNCNDYQYYAGGIVGWASGNHKYINCNVEESTIIGGQWGDFGNANGGLIGGIGTSAEILFKDCTVACRIDAVNDVVSAYQWYCYRNSGMLIGRVPQTITQGEAQTVKTPENVTCENVTVIYGDWANYTYCEFAGTGYPYVRVQAGVSVGAYVNVRYGHPTDANGNTVVDDNHVHNDGEEHQILIEFDQLFGGPANDRYCYYGIKEYEGVTVVYNNKQIEG